MATLEKCRKNSMIIILILKIVGENGPRPLPVIEKPCAEIVETPFPIKGYFFLSTTIAHGFIAIHTVVAENLGTAHINPVGHVGSPLLKAGRSFKIKGDEVEYIWIITPLKLALLNGSPVQKITLRV